MPQPFPIAALAVCSLALVGAGGCSRNSSSEPTPQIAASASSIHSPAPLDSVAREGAPQVRKAVRDFIAERDPEAKIEGVWSVAFTPNYCIAAADITSAERRRTVEVVVRQFTREDGTDYWRVEGLRLDSASARLLAPRTFHSNSGDFESEPEQEPAADTN